MITLEQKDLKINQMGKCPLWTWFLENIFNFWKSKVFSSNITSINYLWSSETQQMIKRKFKSVEFIRNTNTWFSDWENIKYLSWEKQAFKKNHLNFVKCPWHLFWFKDQSRWWKIMSVKNKGLGLTRLPEPQ